MKKYYDRINNRLIFIKQLATPEYWDKQWETNNLLDIIKKGERERFVSATTRKFIKPNKERKILEGGCGNGQFVYSLQCRGYDAYGVDFAASTIAKIQNVMPELKIQIGDVRSLPYPDGNFDGYWSLGVIEHFFDGYVPIAKEMARVIKPGGFLFLTFPYMSPLRFLKVKMGFYSACEEKLGLSNFYQFALDWKKVNKNFKQFGFTMVYKRPFDGLKGFKDEAPMGVRKIFQILYDCKSVYCMVINYFLSIILSPFCGHTVLLVFRRDQQN